jgi:cytochrome c553
MIVFGCTPKSPPAETLPQDVDATGIHDADVRSFTPQYALWTDGATKKRWIRLPKGTTIDASDPDGWQFPVGTMLWKEFSFGRRVETRFIERTAEGWRFATYAWTDDGAKATLADARGATTTDGHRLPSQAECRVCHTNGKTPVLGFSALQLSADRDPNALHREPPAPGSLDLPALVAEGRLDGFTGTTSPRIPARTANERAALGYLHANCGMCHRKDGPLASIEMILASSTQGADDVLRTTVDRPSHVAAPRARIASGRPNASVVVDRMRARDFARMPPLGTNVVDDQAVRLVTTWIEEMDERKGENR